MTKDLTLPSAKQYDNSHEHIEQSTARSGHRGSRRRQFGSRHVTHDGRSEGYNPQATRGAGQAWEEYQRKALRNLNCKRIQCDEIWQFCYAKQKNVPAEKQGQFGFGDVWTWVAIDAESKLIPTWAVGQRDAGTAFALMEDLAAAWRIGPVDHGRSEGISGRS